MAGDRHLDLVYAPGAAPDQSDRGVRIVLFVCWIALTLYLAAHHEYWRDEVRAFSLALSGGNVAEMLRVIHGEGHPALWYLMLRGAHTLVPVREVLPAVTWLVGAAAAALLVWRAPFRLAVIAILLFGEMMAFEYAVMARNYGIGMLIAFAVAAFYSVARDRWRGGLLGLLLLLLCNTSVPAVLLAGGFLAFWLIELAGTGKFRRGPALLAWAVAALFTAIGAALAFVTVYPPFNDAAMVSVRPQLADLADPLALADLVPRVFWETGDMTVPLTILLVGAILGLVRRPAAIVAAVLVFSAMSLFFHLVYPGSYRHEALFLVFMISLYWLVAAKRGAAWPARWQASPLLDWTARIGNGAFVVLLALQLVGTLGDVAAARSGPPFSRSRDLGALLQQRGLRDAIVLGHPDWVLEPLPYYAHNPVYLMRQRVFGHVTRFATGLPRVVGLADYLRAAETLQRRYRRPVVIVIAEHLAPGMARIDVSDGLAGRFVSSGEDIARFLTATRRIAHFGRARSDETYDVYLLARESSDRSNSATAKPAAT